MKKLLLTLVSLLMLSANAGFGKKNIVEVAKEAGTFNTLLTALEVTGLTDTVATAKDLTVFAPNDEAFAKIPAETLQYLINNPEELKAILLYHVAGKKLKAKKVLGLNEIKTLAGKTILTNKKEEGLFLNESQVIATDIKAKNGIIHVIDSVLLPSENSPSNTFETAEFVELEKYMGEWYEYARYENKFQKNCLGTKAIYKLKGKRVRVQNICQKADGKTQGGKAWAKVVDKKTNSVLSVSFVPVLNYFGFFGGDYRILAIGADYEYALVGDAARTNFWILTRNKEIPEALYQELLDVAESKGFRKELIRKSPVWK